jgi:hypothetical protein
MRPSVLARLLTVKSKTPAPQISVILGTDTFETIRAVVESLRAQRCRDRIELVIVAPSSAALRADEEALADFWGVQILEREITNLAPVRAAGIRVATAPVVFLAETHSFPQPGFAEAIVAAHEGPWAVVMPGIGNANPATAISWAELLTDYGPWLQELPAGVIDRFPTWPTTFKRDVLLALGDRLPDLLTQGDGLVRALSEAGHRFYFEPAARVHHLNASSHGPWIRERYYSGVSIASSRRGGWSWIKRLIYICGAPLIPAVVILRARKGLQACAGSFRMLRVIPAIAATTTVSAIGEAVGYAGLSAETACHAMTEFEIHREA